MPSRIAIVDDEPSVRDSLQTLLGMHGFYCKLFESGDAFLATQRNDFDCVFLDIRMPGRDGLQTLVEYRKGIAPKPVIMMSGHADISIAVKAMRLGAINFFEKPFQKGRILEAVSEAMQVSRDMQRALENKVDLQVRMEQLTPRERDVARLICAGLLNKQIAHELGISVRTVETHRGNLMSKMGVRTVAALVSILPISGLDGIDG
ncbi:transcriptional regulatory protein FixJ [Algimonas ampicilliniresistens]|uniref:Transcriptional regulatory protein FixJ n=1 Tax=Algimonas ampicilliniresistens TaxID=1298735 RepID=A0ABQ5V4N3_9PROT|nr:response regulator [Algimonas ampicilliniresistens]GLQ22496.1 transcriptional regulatory protein FixJ [Algimonas ampicilliniresistens]